MIDAHERPSLQERILKYCAGQPATVAWPHRILHEAVAKLNELETTLEWCQDNTSDICIVDKVESVLRPEASNPTEDREQEPCP